MSSSTTNITANKVLDLLRTKHSDDVFVEECKNGPTHFTRDMLKIDAWAMKRSWANPLVTAYEIKVARSDFFADEKWRKYLDYCNSFYFVAPDGVIRPDELPADAGLLRVSKTGTRLYTKKKAPPRDIEIPEDIWRYILMCRTSVTREGNGGSREQFWRDWLAEKDEKKSLGYRVSEKIQELVAVRIDKVESENRKLRSQIEVYAECRKILDAAGIQTAIAWTTRSQLQTEIQSRLLAVIPADFKRHLDILEATIQQVRDEWALLEEHQERGAA